MSRHARPLAALLGAALLLAPLASGCKPKPGGSCKLEGAEVCTGDKEALACHDGKWEPMHCQGPAGCASSESDSTCDQSVAKEEEVCNLANNFVCTADKQAMLECQKNRWVLAQRCAGERGCTIEQKKVTCDNSVASVGDACPAEDEGIDYACSPDKRSALVCRGGAFVLASPCKGPKGCRLAGDKSSGFKVECDDSIANVGDTCEREGHYSCAPDERSIVKCKDKKYVQDDKCRAKEKCQVRGDQVGCY